MCVCVSYGLGVALSDTISRRLRDVCDDDDDTASSNFIIIIDADAECGRRTLCAVDVCVNADAVL